MLCAEIKICLQFKNQLTNTIIAFVYYSAHNTSMIIWSWVALDAKTVIHFAETGIKMN